MVMALLTFLLVLRFADSRPDYEPPYGEKLNPKPFQYEYGLESTSSGAAFSKKEAQDDRGNVIGEVVVSLPDGRIQTTNYNADFYRGYNADVRYAGTPQYPKDEYQNYNSPTFIPVHLKSRPSLIKQKTERNRYKAPTLQSNSGFLNRKKQSQPQLKSIESSEIIPEISTKPQEIKFESEKINAVNIPEEARTRQEKFASNSESLAQQMAKVRGDLKKIHSIKESPPSIPQNNAHSEFVVQGKQTFQNRPLSTSKPERMLEIMKQIREDLKGNNEAITSKMPSVNPETPPLMVIKSHVMSGPKDKMIEIMKQNVTKIQKSEKLIISPVPPKTNSFQNRPLSSRRPDQTENSMKMVRENLKVNVMRRPSVDPETPPLMIIKSHISSRPNHEQAELIKQELPNVPKVMKKNVKSPMSIKSHVITAPKPAESMEEIMKKIREDIEDKEHPNEVEILTLVMKMKPHVNQAPEVMQVMSHVIENPKVGELSIVKPIRDNVVDFMKKVEIMKESKRKPNNSIMSVKSRVIQQSNKDADGNVSMNIMPQNIPESSRLETVPSNEESSNHARY